MPKTSMVILTAVFACVIPGGQEALTMDLNQFKWKNRLLFIFSPQDSDAIFRALQLEISSHQSNVSERDLVVFQILETGPSCMGANQISPQTAAEIRDKFAAPIGRFTCVLVGKDGGIKLRRSAQIELKDIFDLIDAMPMRQEEIRQKGQKGES